MNDNMSGKTLVSYRLESACEKLSAAVDLIQNGHYKDSVGRSYYAIFTAARALLATKQLDSSKPFYGGYYNEQNGNTKKGY